MKEKVPQLFNKYYGKNLIFPYSNFFVVMWILISVVFLPIIFCYAANINYENDESTSLIVTDVIIACVIFIIGIAFSVKMIRTKIQFMKNLKSGNFELRKVKVEDKYNDVEMRNDYCYINNELALDLNHFIIRYDDGNVIEVPVVVYNSININSYAYVISINSHTYVLPLD